MMRDVWTPWGGGGMGIGPILWIALIALAVWLVVSLVRRREETSPSAPGRDRSALDILDERFAKGEIDKDEYEARRKVLKG